MAMQMEKKTDLSPLGVEISPDDEVLERMSFSLQHHVKNEKCPRKTKSCKTPLGVQPCCSTEDESHQLSPMLCCPAAGTDRVGHFYRLRPLWMSQMPGDTLLLGTHCYLGWVLNQCISVLHSPGEDLWLSL